MSDMHLLGLKGNLYARAAAFTKAQGDYMEAHHADPASARTRQAALDYRAAATPYQKSLDECEAYLRSIERGDSEEADLHHILTFQRDVKILLKMLDEES